MDRLEAGLVQSEWKNLEKAAVEFLVSQPTPVINAFRSLNRNNLHRVLNQLSRSSDAHVQSLSLALLTDYIACDCLEMDIGTCGEWDGTWHKNTIQLLHKLDNTWRNILSNTHEVLTKEQFQAQIDILERSANRLADLKVSWCLRDIVRVGRTLLETEPKQFVCDSADFTEVAKLKTPKQSKSTKSSLKRSLSQPFCWQPTPKRAASCSNDRMEKEPSVEGALTNQKSTSCDILKRMLLQPCVNQTTVPFSRSLAWDVKSDSEDDSWLMESPLGIPNKLWQSPAKVIQQPNVIAEIKKTVSNDIISISDDSSSIDIDRYSWMESDVLSRKNAKTSIMIDPSFSEIESLSPAEQENQNCLPTVAKVSVPCPVKQLCPSPLKELTNKVSAMSPATRTFPPGSGFKAPTPVKDSFQSDVPKCGNSGLKDSDSHVNEVIKKAATKCSPNWSLGKKTFQKNILAPEDITKFKTGNVVNAFALMMARAKKLA